MAKVLVPLKEKSQVVRLGFFQWCLPSANDAASLMMSASPNDVCLQAHKGKHRIIATVGSDIIMRSITSYRRMAIHHLSTQSGGFLFLRETGLRRTHCIPLRGSRSNCGSFVLNVCLQGNSHTAYAIRFTEKKKDRCCDLSSFARNGTWTRTVWTTRPSNVRVCQFRHSRVSRTIVRNVYIILLFFKMSIAFSKKVPKK